MTSKIQKLGDRRIVALPPELLAELGWDAGDVLTAEIFEDGIKFVRTSGKHNEALQIARKAMKKYRSAFEALAKL
jgi:antitoxin component of MazEF toxin-antitoxin module